MCGGVVCVWCGVCYGMCGVCAVQLRQYKYCWSENRCMCIYLQQTTTHTSHPTHMSTHPHKYRASIPFDGALCAGFVPFQWSHTGHPYTSVGGGTESAII